MTEPSGCRRYGKNCSFFRHGTQAVRKAWEHVFFQGSVVGGSVSSLWWCLRAWLNALFYLFDWKWCGLEFSGAFGAAGDVESGEAEYFFCGGFFFGFCALKVTFPFSKYMGKV